MRIKKIKNMKEIKTIKAINKLKQYYSPRRDRCDESEDEDYHSAQQSIFKLIMQHPSRALGPQEATQRSYSALRGHSWAVAPYSDSLRHARTAPAAPLRHALQHCADLKEPGFLSERCDGLRPARYDPSSGMR